ncbi:MAG: hypothetical protein A2X22_12260 [Bacteroidetes bacterium GWF2_49_14]|nr:MAG: hypothetical protein A2X22_12260 [Bacteroidetes bacterium GWF2_49_14]HBB92630.1 hypothetical protein [Bacteroidales bacterium]
MTSATALPEERCHPRESGDRVPDHKCNFWPKPATGNRQLATIIFLLNLQEINFSLLLQSQVFVGKIYGPFV